ncbi:BTAD domain-containing putative transcriptional regulator [soil metagenome]
MAMNRPPDHDGTAPSSGNQSHPPSTIQVQLLGRFRVFIDGRQVPNSAWRLTKAGHLVKILALSPSYRRHREELMDLLWPDLSAASAANNLRQILHTIRQSLPVDAGDVRFLVRDGSFISLSDSANVQVDVDAFEQAARLASGSTDQQRFANAIARYPGDLLPDDAYEDWALTRREGLRSIFLSLLSEAADLAEASKDYPTAMARAERSVATEPTDEEAHKRLMHLYALSGRRGDALRQYRLLETSLRRDLDLLPEQATRRLYTDILAYRFPPDAADPEEDETDDAIRARPLPNFLTSFVGRQHDIAAIDELVRDHRLVTLTGIGGVGKTRLATVLAGEFEQRFGDGVHSVDLSPINDPRLVWPVIASALGLQDDLDLLDGASLARLSARDLLLIVDNCEHLTGAVAGAVTTLLRAGDALRILATSREVLHVPGEVIWEIQPLDLPGTATRHSLESLRGSGAVGLFLDRVRQRPPDFILTSESAPYVVDICRRLDGLPLAIEMAAARAATLSLPDLAARLDDAMSLLSSSDRTAPQRHATLEAALDWSYALLEPAEQAVFARLAVFPGSWALPAAEAVVAGDGIEGPAVLEILSELIDKSLVVREGDAVAVRFRFLSPVRQYAVEQLQRSGEADLVKRKHATMLLDLAERATPELRGPNQAKWMRRLERERADLHIALAWALDADPTLALQLAVASGRFWYVGGHLREGRDALHAALKATPDGDMRLRAEALYHAGILADEAGNHHQAAKLLEAALELFRQQGDLSRTASVLNSLGVVARASGDLERARELLEESLAIRRTLGDPTIMISTLGNLALLEWSRGDLDRAGPLLEETLALAQQSGDDWSVAISSAHLGRIAWDRGEFDRALEMFAESLQLARQVGDRGAVADGLEGLAGALAGLRASLEAARFWGAAEALRESLAIPVPTPELPLYERMVAVGREHLDEPAFDAAWAAGRDVPLDQIVDEALSAALQTPPSDHQPVDDLTDRQREIAGLIAEDLTNQEIADELGIAPRTVDTHVSNILKKLGCSSRTDVARLVQQ